MAFFGSVVEADFAAAIRDRDRDLCDIWLDPGLRRQHRPKLVCGTEILPHYFTKTESTVHGQTQLFVNVGQQRSSTRIVVKADAEQLLGTENRIELVVDRDYRAAVIGAMLKSAHLTMFELLGYSYVFSPSGTYVGSILGSFYDQHNGSHNVTEHEIDKHFLPCQNMVVPLIVSDDASFRGSISDQSFLFCRSSRSDIFSLGVIVKAGTDRFCVFLPGDYGIDTYFSFIQEPPPSARVVEVKFIRASGESKTQGRWEMAPTDVRIPLRRDERTSEDTPP